MNLTCLRAGAFLATSLIIGTRISANVYPALHLLSTTPRQADAFVLLKGPIWSIINVLPAKSQITGIRLLGTVKSALRLLSTTPTRDPAYAPSDTLFCKAESVFLVHTQTTGT